MNKVGTETPEPQASSDESSSFFDTQQATTVVEAKIPEKDFVGQLQTAQNSDSRGLITPQVSNDMANLFFGNPQQ